MPNEQYPTQKPYRVHEPLRRCPEACPAVLDQEVTDADLGRSLVEGLADSAFARDPYSVSKGFKRLLELEASENASVADLLNTRFGNAPTADDFIFIDEKGNPLP